MKNLDKKVVWVFLFSTPLWVSLIISLWIWSALFAALSGYSDGTGALVSLFLIFIVVAALIGLNILIAFLKYKFYKYEVADDAFHSERGIISKKYVSIPYDRIQNVDIHRGILDRLLGLSDLDIQTAGRSSSGFSSESRLPGIEVNDAVKLRDDLIKRAKGARSGV